ncbi:MAG: phage tail protein [Bacteroidetes bacterium]|nr:MAG: phage tail protein [Bacteroidota bacterium]PTM08594.1 MAG: phage tail protein [Bacteroidota bacterium]
MEGMIGEIRLFGGNFAPRSWAFCNGQLLAISQNSALFSILGTTYGGDGQTTFGLPDLRGRTAIGQGNGPGLSSRQLGEQAGTPTVTLNVNQLPSHSHTAVESGGLQTGTGKGDSGNPQGNYIDDSSIATDLFKPTGGGPIMKGGEGVSVVNANTGGNQAHNNMQPYLAVYYVICLQGIYPSRN